MSRITKTVKGSFSMPGIEAVTHEELTGETRRIIVQGSLDDLINLMNEARTQKESILILEATIYSRPKRAVYLLNNYKYDKRLLSDFLDEHIDALNRELLELFLDLGAKPSEGVDVYETLIRHGNVDSIKILIKYDIPLYVTEEQWTELLSDVDRNSEMIELFIRERVDMSELDIESVIDVNEKAMNEYDVTKKLIEEYKDQVKMDSSE